MAVILDEAGTALLDEALGQLLDEAGADGFLTASTTAAAVLTAATAGAAMTARTQP